MSVLRSQTSPPVHPAFETGLHSMPVPASFAATVVAHEPPDFGVAGTVHSNGLTGGPASPGLASDGPTLELFVDETTPEDETRLEEAVGVDEEIVEVLTDEAALEVAVPEVVAVPDGVLLLQPRRHTKLVNPTVNAVDRSIISSSRFAQGCPTRTPYTWLDRGEQWRRRHDLARVDVTTGELKMHYFTKSSLRFLQDLEENNSRECFGAHKDAFKHDVRDPALRLVADLAGPMKRVSKHFTVDARPTGGSLTRMQRDIRFSKDKSPYKTWLFVHFKHASESEDAPALYVHIAPGSSTVGAAYDSRHPRRSRRSGTRWSRLLQRGARSPRAWVPCARCPARCSSACRKGMTPTIRSRKI